MKPVAFSDMAMLPHIPSKASSIRWPQLAPNRVVAATMPRIVKPVSVIAPQHLSVFPELPLMQLSLQSS